MRARSLNTAATLAGCGLLPDLVEKLGKTLGVAYPTDIQQRVPGRKRFLCALGVWERVELDVHLCPLQSLPSVLEGRHAVINAETGSGKTLCRLEVVSLPAVHSSPGQITYPVKGRCWGREGFLLPVLQNLTKLALKRPVARIPSPYSVALAPTPHLANQINAVFSSLAEPDWGSCVVYKGSRMLLKPNTHFLVGTPNCIAQYDILKIFRDVRVVCVDEADVLLTGTEREATWEILKLMKQLQREDKRRDVVASEGSGESTSLPSRQLIFSAATLPGGGPRTVYSLLKNWLPRDTQFITTEGTHQIIPTAQTLFIDIHNPRAGAPTGSDSCEELTQLRADAHTHSHSQCVVSSFTQLQVEHKLAALCGDLKTLGREHDNPRVLVFANTVATVRTIYSYLTEKAEVSEVEGQNEGEELEEWWKGGGTGVLHKGVPSEEREETLRQFREGVIRVLVCTDLISRGLDLPEVAAVIQFDFPGNSADFLHRAGRTARAGRDGVVIAYVCDSDQDLANEIKRVLADQNKSFAPIFSRNKMLRRKINARKAREKQSQEETEN